MVENKEEGINISTESGNFSSVLPREGLDYNIIECRDCIRGISLLDKDSINLVVTAPPIYDTQYFNTYEEYKEFIRVTFYLVYNKLVEGGVIALNFPSKVESNNKRIPLVNHIGLILEDIGFVYREDIIWDKGVSNSKEVILIYTKGNTVLTELESTIWKINAIGNKGGVAPYPVELSTKLINLYSQEGDLVLDPFVGTGTTAISCIKTKRKYICYDNNESLVNLSNTLIERYKTLNKG